MLSLNSSCLYLILVGFIRFVTPKECRSWPFNMVVHVGYTVLLCLLSFILSVGFGDVFFAGLVPVTLGSLYFAYLIFRRLVTADEDAKFKASAEQATPTFRYKRMIERHRDVFQVDVSTPGFYYAIPTLISAGVIIFWPTIYFLLSITDSVAGAEDIGRSLLFEGIPAIPIGGTILLVSFNLSINNQTLTFKKKIQDSQFQSWSILFFRLKFITFSNFSPDISCPLLLKTNPKSFLLLSLFEKNQWNPESSIS